MKSSLRKRLRSLVNRSDSATTSSPQVAAKPYIDSLSDLDNAVDAYYRHHASINLRALYRFAIQSRSNVIRDVFAKASSSKNLDLNDLLSVLEGLDSTTLRTKQRTSLAALFDSSTLLALADLIANTARDDLDTFTSSAIYNFVYNVYGVETFSDQQLLLYVESLNDIQNFDKARELAHIHTIGEIAPLQPELLDLQRIRCTSSPDDWLKQLNSLYEAAEMTRVRFLDKETLPLLDRLAAGKRKSLGGPRVSIIMPTFSPGEGIRTAIRSLVEQTWENLEIIIVDDASPREFQKVFTELKETDSRIRVLHQEKNAGAYVARNAGLSVSTGDFITTADDDDWSHPDKIASQVTALIDDPLLMATTSAHIRSTEDLKFMRLNSSAQYLQRNYSSLMVRRQVVDEIGNWDSVNRGADSEFFSRVKEYYGAERVKHLELCPLAFSRVWQGSLTSGEMYRGYIGTPRVMYLWAVRQWRWDQTRMGQKPVLGSSKPRPYAVPSSMEPGQRKRDLGLFDVIYVTDFFRQAKYVNYALAEMTTLIASGLRIGYVHLGSPLTTQHAGFPRELFDLQQANKITQVSLDDKAETKLLIIHDSSVGMFVDEIRSPILTHRLVVVERQLPSLHGQPQRTPTSYRQVLSNLDRAFGSFSQIVGATMKDQERIANHVPATRRLPDSDIWRPHIKAPSPQIKPPTGKPVVGFHTQGNKYRWPSNKDTFQKVYVSDSYQTRLSGQLKPAFDKFGQEAFSLVQIIDDQKQSTSEFLSGLDFWIYHPDRKLDDEIWEPVLAAMGAGKVVILPPRLKKIYLDGAIYGHPDEIKHMVLSLAANREAYENQAELGVKFVRGHFSEDLLYKRVRALVSK